MPWLEPSSPFSATSSRTVDTRPEKTLKAAIAVLALVCLGLLYFLLQAPGRSPEARQRQVQELEAQKRTLESQVRDLRSLSERVQSATQSGQDFAANNFLGRTNAFSSMVKDLEQLATRNRLRPSNINYSLLEQTNALGWTGVQVSLALEGDYANVVRFINQVEKSKIFWIIRGLDVAGSTEDGLRLSLTAETYLLPS